MIQAQERRMVAAAIKDSRVMRLSGLVWRDFSDPACAVVWQKIAQHSASGEVVSLFNVASQTEQIWILDAMNTIEPWEWSAGKVRLDSLKRQVSGLLIEAANVNETDGPGEAIARLRTAVATMGMAGQENASPIAEALPPLLAEIERRWSGDKSDRVLTGIDNLDTKIGGLAPGQLAIIAGRPGYGKTALAVTMAVNAQAKGHHALFVSREMGAGELTQRILSAAANIQAQKLATGAINREESSRIVGSASRVAKYRLWIDTRSSRIDDILTSVHRWRAAQTGKTPIVFVDYLQLVLARSEKGKNREREVAEITRDLKLLAGEIQCPVVVLAQLNRGIERDDRLPGLSDLRESGAIEQDADIVLFPWRECDRTPDGRLLVTRSSGPARVIVGKHRNGEIGECWAYWKADTMQFLSEEKSF